MSEELETVLRLVAEGKLAPGEAAPIIEALARAERADAAPRHGAPAKDIADASTRVRAFRGRQLRIRVTEHGRQVVNLRIPIGFVDTALQFVPGISGEQAERIREAVDSGASGPIIDVDDPDGSGVLISVE